MKKIIIPLLFFTVIAIKNGIFKNFVVNLWQSVLFILNIMKDIILHIGINDKIVATIIFIGLLIILAISGISISRKRKNKLKSYIETTTEIVSTIVDLKNITKIQ